MSDTLTRIPEGARVLYIGGGEEHQPDLIGRFGTVQRDDKSDYIPYYVDFDNGNYPRWWCPREALVHVPQIGDKIIPVDGELVGIPAEYRNAVGTVTGVFTADGNTRARIVAEYRSYQKPDDTIEWSTYEWKPADGHTITVSDSYRPTVGDRVQMTGYLSSEGIKVGITAHGTVAAVDGDIWTIDTALLGTQVSGPGYVFPVLDTDIVEPDLTPSAQDFAALSEKVNELTRELARANERVEEFRTRAGKWERDFMRSWERVGREATEREWCGVYEEVVEEVQETLEIGQIPAREVEVEIEWDETYTVTVRRTGTVTLPSGYDESDIEDAARRLNGDSDADRSEVLDAVRNGAYESDCYVDDSAQEG